MKKERNDKKRNGIWIWSHLYSRGDREKVREGRQNKKREEMQFEGLCLQCATDRLRMSAWGNYYGSERWKRSFLADPWYFLDFQIQVIILPQVVLWFSEPRSAVVLIEDFVWGLYCKSSSLSPWSLLFPVLPLTSGKGFGIWDLGGDKARTPFALCFYAIF